MQPTKLYRRVDQMVARLTELGLASEADALVAVQLRCLQAMRELCTLDEVGVPREAETFKAATKRYNLLRQMLDTLIAEGRALVSTLLGHTRHQPWQAPNRKLRHKQTKQLQRSKTAKLPPYGSYAQVFGPRNGQNRTRTPRPKGKAGDGDDEGGGDSHPPNINPHCQLLAAGVGAFLKL